MTTTNLHDTAPTTAPPRTARRGARTGAARLAATAAAAAVLTGCIAAEPGGARAAGADAARIGTPGASGSRVAATDAPPMTSTTTPSAAAAGVASVRGVPPDDGGASLAALQALVRDECRSDADCATLGVGRRPCGGPERYIAYSTTAGDTAALKAAAAAHERARARGDDNGRGMVSTCEVVVDPGAVCRMPAAPAAASPPASGRCETRKPPARGAATR